MLRSDSSFTASQISQNLLLACFLSVVKETHFLKRHTKEHCDLFKVK